MAVRYGRKHTLTREKIEAVVRALREDRVSLGGAARRILVPYATLATWLHRGRSGEGTLLERELAAAVDAVLYEMESEWARGFETANNWQRYKELLKARFPSSWGSLFGKNSTEEIVDVEIVDRE
ncbi:MAG: hypothetical protein KatS3mg023_4007 [Armatimonadota bacterium]|nr:MAG: hypothetical protein KatS3mg023_4007 [Armatimonadota bacterium]